MIKNKINYILNYNILEHLICFYRNIPSLYKTTFWTTFIILNIVFAYHTISFFWGNHDWPFMVMPISWRTSWYEARFTETWLYLLMNFNFLPVLLNIFGFTGISLSAIGLASYWKIPPKKTSYICFCLIFALLPYNLCWLYHIAQTSYFYGCFILTSGLLLFERKRSSHIFFWWNTFVILILFFVISTNAAFINVMCILVLGRSAIDFIQGKSLKNIIVDGLILLFDIACAALLLKSAMLWADHYNILYKGYYNIQHISLSEVPGKFLTVMKYSWQQFYIIYPFLPRYLLNVLLMMTAVSLITVFCCMIKRGGFCVGGLIFTFMLVALLFATQLAIFISTNETKLQFLFRIAGYFGLYYFFMLMLTFLFNFWNKEWLKNILFLVAVSIMFMSAYNDMYAMRVWKLGRDAEEKIMQRVFSRFESIDSFSYDKEYKVVVVGDISMRKNYYNQYYDFLDVTTLGWSFRAFWSYLSYLNLNAPGVFVTQQIKPKDLLYMLSIKDLEDLYNNAEAWPHKNSVLIKNDIIFLFLQAYELSEFKQMIREFLNLQNK